MIFSLKITRELVVVLVTLSLSYTFCRILKFVAGKMPAQNRNQNIYNGISGSETTSSVFFFLINSNQLCSSLKERKSEFYAFVRPTLNDYNLMNIQ